MAGGIFGVKTRDFRKTSGISREKMRDFGVKGGIFGVDVFFSSKKWHFRVENAWCLDRGAFFRGANA